MITKLHVTGGKRSVNNLPTRQNTDMGEYPICLYNLTIKVTGDVLKRSKVYNEVPKHYNRRYFKMCH